MFKSRLISGIVLIVIALAVLILGGPVLAGTLLVISLIAFRELTKALSGAGTESGETEKNSPEKAKQHVGCDPAETVGLIGIVIYYAALFFGGTHTWLVLCITAVFLALMFVYVMTFPRYDIAQITDKIFAFLYAPVMLSFVYLTRNSLQGSYIVWMILISSWGCDTCAYVIGMLFGKKKIFPVLSPKKSLEGCIGGVAGAALIGGLYGRFCVENAFPGQTVWWLIALICAAGAVMSQIGDLAASAVKRNRNIKDYGKLIPGHGGIMDRFDSVIVTAPMIYFLTALLMSRF